MSHFIIIFWIITLTFGAFLSPALFVKELHKSFGTGFVINSAMNKSHLSDYLIYLKDECFTANEVIKYKETGTIGYVGNTYRFPGPTVQYVSISSNYFTKH